ncbi:MAG: alanyl-tRNA editing protein [Clostridia bacterium]|nr:alanyl-tRNA editing protein [Clostridia bacterium]
MSTVRLFDDNSYLTEFTATVTSCRPWENGFAVTLDRTAFCPEGGGQKGDSGILGDATVIHTVEDDDILHLTDRRLVVGQTIKGRIDWDRRWYRMQHHSGEHVLSGLVTAQYGFHNVGFHLGDELVTIDYDGVLSREQLDALECEANAVICQNRAITASYPSPEELSTLPYRSKKEIDGALRIVVVEGIDICACCAPHVGHTGEIGILKITDMKHYKGGVRLQMVCGNTAVRDYQQKQALTSHITTALSTVQEKGIAAFDAHIAAVDAATYENDRLLLAVAEELSAAYAAAETTCVVVSALTGDAARHLARSVAERTHRTCVVLNAVDSGYRYTMYCEHDNFTELVKAANAALQGKGGGRPPFASGAYQSTLGDIRRWFIENS